MRSFSVADIDSHMLVTLFPLLSTEQWDQPRSSPRTDPRLERDQEFAPPSFYYEETNTTQCSTQYGLR